MKTETMDIGTLLRVIKMLDSRINKPVWAHTTLTDAEFIVNLREYLQGYADAKMHYEEMGTEQ
jgi:hypothetical protein